MARTNIEFTSSDDVMGLIRLWTLDNGFEIVEKRNDDYKLYKKPKSMFRGHDEFWLQIDRNGSTYSLSAWIKNTALLKLTADERPLTGKMGLKDASKPVYRKQLNNLLKLLELPKI